MRRRALLRGSPLAFVIPDHIDDFAEREEMNDGLRQREVRALEQIATEIANLRRAIVGKR